MKKKVINSLIVIGCLVGIRTVQIPLGYLIENQVNMSSAMVWGIGLLYLVGIVAVIACLWRYYRKQKPDAQVLGWKDVGIALLSAVVLRIIVALLMLARQSLTGPELTGNDTALFGVADQLRDGHLLVILLFLSYTSVIAPFVEELVFRGLFTELLFKNTSKWWPGIVSSIVFGVAHLQSFDLMELVFYSLLGGMLYLSYARRGEIKDSILLHILNNLLPTLALAYQIFIGNLF